MDEVMASEDHLGFICGACMRPVEVTGRITENKPAGENSPPTDRKDF